MPLNPSVNIRELRDTRRLKTWLKEGRTVELRERDTVLAQIIPIGKPASAQEWPDFEARVIEVIGDRVLSGVDQFLADRGRY
jgi:antitoxin (DNA-binding transcriptional repressor) of toxin-antitoxin stability system